MFNNLIRCRNLFYIIVLAFSSLPTSNAQAETTSQLTTEEYANHIAFTLGQWDIADTLLRPGGMSETVHFTVNSQHAIGNHGAIGDWYSEDGTYFGTVITTYNPDTHLLTVNYYNAATKAWSKTEQGIEFHAMGYITRFSNEDGFGTFESETRVSHEEGVEGYTLVTRRKYEGSGTWLTIDEYQATPRS